MKFLDALKDLLRSVERGEVRDRSTAREFDLAAARRYFLEALERVERGGDSPERGAQEDLPRFLSWIRSGDLDAFFDASVTELRRGFCANSSRSELQRHLHQVIDVTLGIPLGGISRVRRTELQRIASMAQELVEQTESYGDRVRYATELRLLRAGGGVLALSPIGRVLVGLPERDAVNWLLLLETQQSLGVKDEWRVPLEAVEFIANNPEKTFFYPPEPRGDDDDEQGAEELPPLHYAGFCRLASMGVIEHWDNPTELEEWGYTVQSAYEHIVEEVAEQRRTPLYILAETLIAGERREVVRQFAPAGAIDTVDAGSLALERHSRMVAHELHNAMTPVQHALRKLYESLERHSPEAAWREYQRRIDRNVDRVLGFADRMAEVSALAVQPTEPFDPAAAVRDAIAELNGGLAERVTFAPQGEIPRVLGHRHRFVMVAMNLLRNATQSVADRPVRVRIDLAGETEGGVRLAVHDDGPGVAEPYREAIFQPGFTLRVGGQGQGLALVRDVIEREMSGSIRYEPSDLGGACFVVALPVASRGST
jgi:signal transduction histidine kinase